MTDLLYRRQFVAGPEPLSIRDFWKSHALAPRLHVTCDNLLATSRAGEGGERELFALGHLLDPSHPEHDNREVLESVLRRSGTFAELEGAMAGLSGRWLLFARVGEEWRVYPDAAGLKAAFHGRDENGAIWLCSQPGLVGEKLRLQLDHDLVRRFRAGHRGNSWPGEITPYPGIRQLLPNHYLDLESGAAVRFWSGRDLENLGLEKAAVAIGELLHGAITAAALRGPVSLPVTGGYDSRVLLACAGARRRTMRCFCIEDPTTPRVDLALLKQLGKAADVHVEVVRTEPTPRASRDAYRSNIADMYWDRGSMKFYTFCRYTAGTTVLTGGTGELLRCFFYKDGNHPAHVDAAVLAGCAGYEGNPVAIESFGAWLEEAPKDSRVAPLDLLYWEHRLGNWLSLSGNAFDAAVEVVPPLNCRRVFEIGLGLPVEHRREPYELMRKICAIRAPETARVPFNEHWSVWLTEGIESFLPWRLRHAWMGVRMRMRGLTELDDA